MEAARTRGMAGYRQWRLSHGGPPATAWAEGAQFNGRPSLQTAALSSTGATASAQGLQARSPRLRRRRGASLTAPLPLWDDGTYLGVNDVPTPQVIRVAVDITGGRIVTIRLLQHPAWHTPEEQERLLRLVVASQTTEGHVPRGTESEQDHLLRAIDDALRKAQSSH